MIREEAIQVLKEYRTIVMNCLGAETPAFDMAIEALQREEHLVELEAKAVAIIKSERHGEWINKQKPNINYIPPYNCSECGGAGYGTDYCPNCGAKMDKK